MREKEMARSKPVGSRERFCCRLERKDGGEQRGNERNGAGRFRGEG